MICHCNIWESKAVACNCIVIVTEPYYLVCSKNHDHSQQRGSEYWHSWLTSETPKCIENRENMGISRTNEGDLNIRTTTKDLNARKTIILEITKCSVYVQIMDWTGNVSGYEAQLGLKTENKANPGTELESVGVTDSPCMLAHCCCWSWYCSREPAHLFRTSATFPLL